MLGSRSKPNSLFLFSFLAWKLRHSTVSAPESGLIKRISEVGQTWTNRQWNEPISEEHLWHQEKKKTFEINVASTISCRSFNDSMFFWWFKIEFNAEWNKSVPPLTSFLMLWGWASAVDVVTLLTKNMSQQINFIAQFALNLTETPFFFMQKEIGLVLPGCYFSDLLPFSQLS